MVKISESLKPNVVALCARRGMNLSDLARRLKTQPQQLSRQLRGDTDVRISLLDRLADALEVSPAELLKSPQDQIRKEGDVNSVTERLKKLEQTVYRGRVSGNAQMDALIEELSSKAGNTRLIRAISAMIHAFDESSDSGGRGSGTDGP